MSLNEEVWMDGRLSGIEKTIVSYVLYSSSHNYLGSLTSYDLIDDSDIQRQISTASKAWQP